MVGKKNEKEELECEYLNIGHYYTNMTKNQKQEVEL